MTDGGSLIQTARSPDNPENPYILPPLLEAVFMISRAVIVLVTFSVMLISYIVHATWLDILIRGVTTGILLGLLGWIINWVLGKFFIQAAIQELKDQALDDSNSRTRDFEA